MTVLVYDLKSLNDLAKWETIEQGLSAIEAEDRLVILRRENPKLQIMIFGSTVTNYQAENLRLLKQAKIMDAMIDYDWALDILALEATCSSKS